MADVTRPATWDDVKLVARCLNAKGALWALIDGYAIAAHGYVRLSEDVDILVEPSPENAKRWISALAALPDGASKELEGEEDLFVREGTHAVRINDELMVDIMPSVCGHGWAELEPFIETRAIDGVPVRVLGLSGLLFTKEAIRPKDQADAEVLRRAIAVLRG